MGYGIKVGGKRIVKHGKVVFTSSGTWTVPRGVKNITVCLVGGGGAGMWGIRVYYPASGSYYYENGGGGGAGYMRILNLTVTPRSQHTITVGAGATTTGYGGSSYFDSYACSGGVNGDSDSNGGNGGSGGGGSNGHKFASGSPGNGGTDGYNGGSCTTSSTSGHGVGGAGQRNTAGPNGESGTTTFDGTVYCGGGAGYGGTGGNGGGGNSSTNGTAGTGGGGGGKVNWYSGDKTYTSGGSGTVIITY